MSVNRVILIGRVGKEPEIREVGENKVANFTLATSEKYKNKAGEQVENTEWHNIVIWRGLAKVVESYVKKGMQLYLEGKIETKSYEKDGVTKYSTSIICNNMQMLGGKGEQQPKSEETNDNDPPF